jgi:hypothetical protein
MADEFIQAVMEFERRMFRFSQTQRCTPVLMMFPLSTATPAKSPILSTKKCAVCDCTLKFRETPAEDDACRLIVQRQEKWGRFRQ